MNFSSRAGTVTGLKADRGPNASGIPGRACETHAHAGFGAQVVVQPCSRSVLCDYQVQPAIAVIISRCCATLFPYAIRNSLAWDRAQTSFAVTF